MSELPQILSTPHVVELRRRIARHRGTSDEVDNVIIEAARIATGAMAAKLREQLTGSVSALLTDCEAEMHAELAGHQAFPRTQVMSEEAFQQLLGDNDESNPGRCWRWALGLTAGPLVVAILVWMYRYSGL